MKTLGENIQLEADFVKQLRISPLKKEGYLTRSLAGTVRWGEGNDTSSLRLESHMDEYHPYIRLLYSQTDDEGNKKSFDYKIFLHMTPCNYGGYRYWFMCPLARSGMTCGRLSTVLYKASNYFGCRRCYNLTYQSRKHNSRSSLAFWFRSRKAMNKMEKLELEIKRREYAGKLTSKQQQLYNAYDETVRGLKEFDKSRILSVCK